jgi:hypothetical protein
MGYILEKELKSGKNKLFNICAREGIESIVFFDLFRTMLAEFCENPRSL